MKNIGNTLITFHIFHRSPLLIYCRKLLQKELDGLIQYYDKQSEYNPVGKPVKSYVLR